MSYISAETLRLYNSIVSELENVKSISVGGKTSYDVSGVFDRDLLKYLLCLTVTDGKVGRAETKLIKELMPETVAHEFPDQEDGADLSAPMRQYALNTKAYRYAKDGAPVSLRITRKIDEAYIKDGRRKGYRLSRRLCSFMELLGQDLLALTKDLSSVDCFTTIIGNLNTYVDEYEDEAAGRGKEEDSPTALGPSAGAAQEKQKEKEDEKPEEKEPEKTLEELLAELDELVGLENIKKEVRSMVNLIKIRKLRKEHGLIVPAMSFHMVFYGNPGTGKTTIARLLAGIYKQLGVLSKGQLVEVDRSGLVAGYVGQTAIKTQKVIDSAKGGILFIDEAYALSASGKGDDFGQEAIVTILKAMEDLRDDFIVIVAGYTDLMQQFVQSNPGLKSRFNKYLEFEDYTPEELLEIFKLRCRKAGYEPDEECLKVSAEHFRKACEERGEDYANARDVRNYLEKAIVNQADRLAELEDPSSEDLLRLSAEDVNKIL